MAQSDKPLSAIDWLNQETQTPYQQVNPTDLESPVATSVNVATVAVTELGELGKSVSGLLPLDVAELPEGLWATTDAARLAADLDVLRLDLLSAPRELLFRLMLAQAPANEAIVNVRLHRLMESGAVQASFAMMEDAPPETSDGFALYFDASVLTWQATNACRLLEEEPALSNKPAIKVYCTARVGNWDTAVLQYFTHDTLGDIPRPVNQLLGGFLDPGLVDDMQIPPVNSQAISPLEFRLRESVGAAVPTIGLPLKFVATDLQPAAGWKSQLEAAERLAASGALPPSKLQEIYLLNKAAASGGVWDRVRLMTSINRALDVRDTVALSATLPALWDQGKPLGLLSAYANILAPDLKELRLEDPKAEGIRQRLMWLSGDFGETALAIPADLTVPFEGQDLAKVISFSFSEKVAPRPVDGQAVIDTLSIAAGAQDGDLNALQLSILGLRSLGFEDVARQMAVEYLILVAGA